MYAFRALAEPYRGIGTEPGAGAFPELRVHVVSEEKQSWRGTGCVQISGQLLQASDGGQMP